MNDKLDFFGKKLAVGDYVLYTSIVRTGRSEIRVGKITSIERGCINTDTSYTGIRDTSVVRKVSAQFKELWDSGKILELE